MLLVAISLVAAVGVAAQAGVAIWQATHPRDAARALSGIDLLRHGRPAEAQAIADGMAADADPATRSVLLYDIGNFMLRRGLSIYFTHPLRETGPIIRIAAAEYRAALQADPDNWDARFNLDVADALVNDRGPASPTIGSEMARDRAEIPDQPGAPNGLP